MYTFLWFTYYYPGPKKGGAKSTVIRSVHLCLSIQAHDLNTIHHIWVILLNKVGSNHYLVVLKDGLGLDLDCKSSLAFCHFGEYLLKRLCASSGIASLLLLSLSTDSFVIFPFMNHNESFHTIQ